MKRPTLSARFRKGTTDHDGDGRMGGSLKGDTNMAKAPSKSPAKASSSAKKPSKAATARKAVASTETEALKAEAINMATVEDPQSGGSSMRTDAVPSVAAVKAARKEAFDQQFAAADAKGDPEAIRDAELSRQVRGY